jgi:archaeal flagellar protein FlaH
VGEFVRLRETGIPGLDGQIGGGIPPGASLLVLSPSGNAPFRFLEHFAAAGLRAQEAVYYYNLERPKLEVLANLDRLAPSEGPRTNLQYVDCYSVKLRDLDLATLASIGVENHAPKITDDLVKRILDHARDVPFRVVVESLTESIDAYGLEPTLTMLKILVGVTKMRGGLFLALLVKGVHDPQVEARVAHIVDGVFEFSRERQGFGTYSFLSITKLRGVADAERLLLYKETEQGLRLETTRRVF